MDDDAAGVYKLIGPALIKQDPVEAKSNVQKRLDYISGELSKLDAQLKALEARAEAKQGEVGVLFVCCIACWGLRACGSVEAVFSLLTLISARAPHPSPTCSSSRCSAPCRARRRRPSAREAERRSATAAAAGARDRHVNAE